MGEGVSERLRIDKWLWHARFFKSRGLAAREVTAGHVRLDGVRVTKPAQTVRPGDTLTFPKAGIIRVVRIVALGHRRGPASEAQLLYEDLTPARPESGTAVPAAPRYEGKGRPTKRDRRQLDRDRTSRLE